MFIGVTGHRPQTLKMYKSHTFKQLINFAILQLQQYTVTADVIYTGMALGWDQAIAKACIELNKPFVACIPFEGQESKWLEDQQAYYFRLLKYAEDVVYISDPPYAAWKLMKRNEYVVNDCNTILALWDGNEKGGTYHCVNYATKKNKYIINCWDAWMNNKGV